jgi:demethylmenaquinone methyltransferase/2-methoxy-6-polyprenyl-1,4-benzoquinol methylase
MGDIYSSTETVTVPKADSPQKGGLPKARSIFIGRLFDLISNRYDLFNRLASLGLDQSWRRRAIAALDLVPGMRVLDLASGTGDLSELAAHRLVPLGLVVACDPSAGMLREAVCRLKRSPVLFWHVRCVQAVAEALPFKDATFDAATMGFALRNVADLDATFRQLHRVLKPSGRLSMLEFALPRRPLPRLGHWIWLTIGVTAIGALVTGRLWPFLYLRRSILRFVGPDEILNRLKQAGFTHTNAAYLALGAVILYTARRPDLSEASSIPSRD